MPIQTPIRGIRAFCVAAKCLSFKRTAEQLFITPSAVSHQIRDLEDQLNCELFVRKTRAIELTSIGYQFYKSIEPIMSQLESTIVDFSKQQNNKGLSICIPEFFASEIMVPLLPDWANTYPDIDLQIETTKINQDANKIADLSIMLANSMPIDGQVTELFSIYYVAAVNKSLYLKWKNEGVEALNKVPLILHQARPWAWHQWAEKLGVDNFEPKQIIQFNSMFGVARAAQQGVGIALVPLPNCRSWFSSEFLVKLFDEELHTRDKYYLVQHQFSDNRSEIGLFEQWLKNKLQEVI